MKPKYSFSKNNQLVIASGSEVLTAEGKFIIKENNQLVYQITEPADWRQKNKIPERIALKGKWSLNRNHGLIFSLRKTKNQNKGQLLLKTELVEPKAKALVFTLISQGQKTQSIRILQLKGKWQADKHNRLQFLVKRLKASDTLVFQGVWQVKNNSLRYTYKKAAAKKTQTLYFKGYWQIDKRNRLTYILDRGSEFDFRVYLETPSLIASRGAIKYRVGIGIKSKASVISLYGVWKLHRKTGLSFILEYAGQRIKAIHFGAFLLIRERSKIAFSLKNRHRKPLGIQVTFSRSFLKDNAEWFLRLVQDGNVPRFERGLDLTW